MKPSIRCDAHADYLMNPTKVVVGEDCLREKVAQASVCKATSVSKAVGADARWERSQVEAFMVEAVWTLRRLPDVDAKYRRGPASYWPDMEPGAVLDGGDCKIDKVVSGRLRVRPTPKEIDRCDPILAWLRMLPDLADRTLVFRVAWCFNGVARSSPVERIPWTKVRIFLQGGGGSRQHMRRRYNAALDLIAGVLTHRQFDFNK